MAKSSLRSRIAWATIGIVTSGLTFLSARACSVHSQLTTQQMNTELTLKAHELASVLRLYPEGTYELELSDPLVRTFSTSDVYYIIYKRAGGPIDTSLPPPHHLKPMARYEVSIPGPGNTVILVGRDIQHQEQIEREYKNEILLISGGTLILTFFAGWWTAHGISKRIRRMSAAAAEISATNLNRRLDVSQAEQEITDLARTLNETFDRLQAAMERQARFTADASHELRTPLSILMTQVEATLKKDRTAPEYRETLETCLRAAQRMKAVVDGLLTLARADAGEIKIAREPLDLRPIVEETVAMLEPMAQEHKIALTVSAQSVQVSGDRDRLREVVTNLVSNAIRYNREGGRVEVMLREEGGRALLTVADTGIGIPEADRPHLFERFYRVDKARSRAGGGSGLGLAITKWIVEAHGGSISFTSREGEGATFEARIPKV